MKLSAAGPALGRAPTTPAAAPKLVLAAAGLSHSASAGPAAWQRARRARLAVTATAGIGGGGGSSGGGSSGGGGGSSKGPFDSLRHAERNLLNAVSGSAERAGAEYGEGFIQFRLSGEHINLDVDTLNEQMKIQGPLKHRHSMRPDEAFGLIFQWDNVIANTRELQRRAWRAVAEAEGLPFPSVERPQLYDMRPERAAMDVLLWTRDWKRAQELAWLVATQYARLLMEVGEPLDGVADWLQLMSKTRVPCALVTTMDRHTTDSLLEKLGLRHYFTCTVTADDDMETMAQRYLSAAIKLGRPPNHCVVFAACPTAVTAAHNCTMKAVAVMGTHKAFALKNADLTCASMKELSVYNIRRLFANRGSEHMDLTYKFVGQPPPKRRLTNATYDDEP